MLLSTLLQLAPAVFASAVAVDVDVVGVVGIQMPRW